MLDKNLQAALDKTFNEADAKPLTRQQLADLVTNVYLAGTMIGRRRADKYKSLQWFYITLICGIIWAIFPLPTSIGVLSGFLILVQLLEFFLKLILKD